MGDQYSSRLNPKSVCFGNPVSSLPKLARLLPARRFCRYATIYHTLIYPNRAADAGVYHGNTTIYKHFHPVQDKKYLSIFIQAKLQPLTSINSIEPFFSNRDSFSGQDRSPTRGSAGPDSIGMFWMLLKNRAGWSGLKRGIPSGNMESLQQAPQGGYLNPDSQ